MYDVVIIGAGVTGGMIARRLSACNLKICILEKEQDVAMGATKANSAIIHAGFDAKPGTLKAKLNVEGAAKMEGIAKELGVKYKNNGSLVIGFNEKDEEEIKALYERGIANGVSGLEILNKAELSELEPNLSDKVTVALFAPTAGIICPYELTIAAIGNAMDNGAELIRGFEVTDITETSEGYEIKSADKKIKGKYIVNAAGVYADKIASMVGDNSFKITPRRGEYILLDKECESLISRTIFRTPSKKGKGILVSPTVDGNIIVGPTAEDIEDKDDKSATKKGFEKIISEAKENLKDIPFGKSITSFCGLRATGSTGDFIINKGAKNFINAAAIESPGLSASPAIAKEVCNLLEAEGLKMEKKENFNPYRESMHSFRYASFEEKNEIIKKDKSYGRVICRCEEVTEGEILKAIRTNPKPLDTDGVKRRTRAQMGRCQGGFCTPYVIKLLASELGVSPIEVTKHGKDSYILEGVLK